MKKAISCVNPGAASARRRLLALIATAALAAAPVLGHAQAWPGAKPIRWIVGSVPGGGQDLTARWLSAIMSKSLGQQIVIENKGGAGGTLTVDAVAKSAPDGYTYGVTSNGAMLNAPALYPNLPYDPGKDLVPVGMTFIASFGIVAGPSTKIASIKEMVASIRAEPGKHAYSSAGKGSPHFLAMELFKQKLGLDLREVSYRSTVPAALDVATGVVPYSMLDQATARPHLQSGKIRVLAVTGKTRWAILPDVPTVSEALSPGFEAFAWNGIVTAAGTPPDIVARMSRELVAAVGSDEIARRMADIGFMPWPIGAEESAKVIREGLAVWPDLIRKLGIKAD